MANNRGDPPLGRVGRKGLSEQRIFKIKPYKAGGKHPSQKGKKFVKTLMWESTYGALQRN